MDTRTQAQLYLSDQRGYSQTDFFRSVHLFNFGQYVAEDREPVGVLQVLNDNTLATRHSVTMRVEQNTDVLILPLIGGLEYKSSVGNGFLEAGQSQLFSLTNGLSYEISNPYETKSINYLEIWLTNPSPDFTPAVSQLSFDLSVANTLLPVFSARHSEPENRLQSTGFVGRYAGREEGIYTLKQPENSVFVFILSGVFEVQNRLLHQRDGLGLTAVQRGIVEFEALSNDAVLLLLEIEHQSLKERL